MGSYSLVIKPSAAKELEAISKRDRQRIVRQIQTLTDNPRPMGCEKLAGREQYRTRRGRYRIVYSISDHERIVRVVKVSHRKEAYS